jgi:threonine/homoserine/homoserine lactone efflux protein
MKEIMIYGLAACAGLFIFGYSVHMFIGGLVEPATESWIIAVVCILGAGVIGYMGWDVIRRRRSNNT